MEMKASHPVEPDLPSLVDDPRFASAIFRSVTSGICIADATARDMPIVYVNPAFEKMTGYTSEEIVGNNCRLLQGACHDQPALTTIREALRTRTELLTIVKNFRKDGTPFWNELYLSPVRNAEGVVTHYVGIQSDVTARIELETALRESEKLAAVGRLASSIAHEINNPLESVMNLIYLAQRTECSAETMTYLDLADQEMQRVKLITAQSLRFYKQSTRPQSINPSDLLDSLLGLYAARLRNASVTLQRRERGHLNVLCMESEIRQVLHNLVANAIDAMAAAGGQLLIRTRKATDWRSGRADNVIVTIADTGSGIHPDDLKSIFTAFYTTKGIGGTGLGLWISSEIIKRHNGQLRVRSSRRPGQSGTVFQMLLPMHGLALPH
jgi:two-component system sporulation sensor kinase C